MRRSFCILDQYTSVVVGQAWPVAHVPRLDTKAPSAAGTGMVEKRLAEQVVERFLDRETTGNAFAFDTLEDVVVEVDRSSDAHGAYRIVLQHYSDDGQRPAAYMHSRPAQMRSKWQARRSSRWIR
jgi:hypothetical protein